MLRAVPAIILIADSTSAALRSGIFKVAISRTWSWEIFATFVLFGTPEALSIPAAFLSKTAAGGVFVINVKEWKLKKLHQKFQNFFKIYILNQVMHYSFLLGLTALKEAYLFLKLYMLDAE